MDGCRKNWVEHTAIRVKDLAWYLDFFQNAVGLSITEVQGDEKNPVQVWIGGLQLTVDPDYISRDYTEERGWHIGINVEDVPAVMQRACSSEGVTPFPGKDHWFVLPDGLVIELVCK